MRICRFGSWFVGVLVFCQLVLFGVSDCRSQSAPTLAGPLPPSDVHFSAGETVCTIPFRVVDNSMLLTIMINDSVEVEAVFDSGFPSNGVLILNPELGGRLGLSYVGSVPLGGAGDDPMMADIAVGATVSLPCVSFENQQVLVVRDGQRYSEWIVDAIIGGTVLNSCVVEIDHEQSRLRIYEPGSFEPRPEEEALSLGFSQGIPVIDATMHYGPNAASTVKLLMDTGADLPFSMHSYDNLGLHLREEAPEVYISEGISGDVYGKWARISAMQIGPYRFNNCLVAFPTKGFDEVKAVLGQNGFFGLESQRHFTVTFDYQHLRVYLKPNSRFNDSFEFNMAGLVIRTMRSGVWEVMDVIPQSPGSVAGVKTGDRIVAVDGRSTSSISFPERERIFAKEGQSIRLSIKRADSVIDVTVTLERII